MDSALFRKSTLWGLLDPIITSKVLRMLVSIPMYYQVPGTIPRYQRITGVRSRSGREHRPAGSLARTQCFGRLGRITNAALPKYSRTRLCCILFGAKLEFAVRESWIRVMRAW